VVGLARSISCHSCRGEFALFEPGPSEALGSMLRQRPYDDWRSGTLGSWYEVSVDPDTEDLVTVAPTFAHRVSFQLANASAVRDMIDTDWRPEIVWE
jgi:hypothetical protein